MSYQQHENGGSTEVTTKQTSEQHQSVTYVVSKPCYCVIGMVSDVAIHPSELFSSTKTVFSGVESHSNTVGGVSESVAIVLSSDDDVLIPCVTPRSYKTFRLT